MSFVKSADVIKNLKSYLNARADKVIEVIAKVESHDSVPNIEEIVEASDAVMVARGDLGKHHTRYCTLALFIINDLRTCNECAVENFAHHTDGAAAPLQLWGLTRGLVISQHDMTCEQDQTSDSWQNAFCHLPLMSGTA